MRTRTVALVGSDVPGLRPRFEVEKGSPVKIGQVLFRDRRHPEIAFVSPVAGLVATLAHGPRKTLSACVIDASDATSEERGDHAPPDAEEPRAALLERGLWPAFRTRPYGRMPDPASRPDAIFVNAVRADPNAPDPFAVLDGQREHFQLGVRVLTKLTEGVVYVCQSPGAPIVPPGARVTLAAFSGTLAAGLSSTHIDRLYPVVAGCEVWTIGYQDVAAIGHLFQCGTYQATRVVACAGPAANRPRLIRTTLGARLSELCSDHHGEILSGNALSGRPASYLGRFDDQVTLVQASQQERTGRRQRWQASTPLIPTRALERALAVDIPPVPLLRALAVGDSEAAGRLGVLALVEEDVAALSRHCTSGSDYARLLREVLDNLEAAA